MYESNIKTNAHFLVIVYKNNHAGRLCGLHHFSKKYSCIQIFLFSSVIHHVYPCNVACYTIGWSLSSGFLIWLE